jgi:hypothetical protein
MRQLKSLAVAMLILVPPGVVVADDLTGATALLCAPDHMTLCASNEECTSDPPEELNIPDFIQVDLEAKTLSTTKASGENRSTPIKNIERGDGLIIFQGIENGRAFSWVIEEATGKVSVAVAVDRGGVLVFGACTPTPGSD